MTNPYDIHQNRMHKITVTGILFCVLGFLLFMGSTVLETSEDEVLAGLRTVLDVDIMVLALNALALLHIAAGAGQIFLWRLLWWPGVVTACLWIPVFPVGTAFAAFALLAMIRGRPQYRRRPRFL